MTIYPSNITSSLYPDKTSLAHYSDNSDSATIERLSMAPGTDSTAPLFDASPSES